VKIVSTLLAEITQETVQQIHEIHQKMEDLPDSAFKLMWALSIVIAVAVVIIFLRQRKIAQNQLDLAQLIKTLGEK